MVEKKASEILADLVEKVELLTKICQDTNFNVKTLLTQINLQNKIKQKQDQQDQQDQPVLVNNNSTKKTTVEQAVIYKSNQRPVILASVDVYDLQTGSLLSKQVTGSNGKWKTTIPPGEYKVEIKKGPVENNKAFIERFEISVPNSGILILENKLV